MYHNQVWLIPKIQGWFKYSEPISAILYIIRLEKEKHMTK